MKLRSNGSRRRPNITPRNPNTDRLVTYRSSGMASYDKGRSASNDGRHNRNRDAERGMSRHLRNLPTKLAILTIVGSVLYVTTLDTQVNLTAQTLSTDNALPRPKTVYQQEAQAILKGSIFNRSKLTINVPGFEKHLKDRFQELESVSLTLPLIGHQPIVNLVSKRPVLKLATTQGVFLLDENGTAIIKASDAVNADNSSLPSVIDDSQLTPELGKGVITAASTKFIVELHQYLSQKQTNVALMTLPATADELRVTIKDKPYYVRFGLDNNPAQSAGEYLALINRLTASGVGPSEYIDLRVSERAFYK